jgi:predicted O-methyltransferase YrrM
VVVGGDRRRPAIKVIALLPFRNEAPFLRVYLTGVLPVVDQVVALDDGSTDDGPQILRDAGAEVVAGHSMDPRVQSFGGRRQMLLERGRDLGGTHFVCVDADETLTPHSRASVAAALESLKMGQTLGLKQVNLWRSSAQFRDDWGYRRPLECMFRDDGAMRYELRRLHESRVPEVSRAHRHRLAPDDGAILHLQFVAWRRAQAKQAWYRCTELVDGATSSEVNARYFYTDDSPGMRLRVTPGRWLSGLENIEALTQVEPSWHLDAVLDLFNVHGVERFEPLRIWDVPELREAFEQGTGRAPVPQSTRSVVAARAAMTGHDVANAIRRRIAGIVPSNADVLRRGRGGPPVHARHVEWSAVSSADDLFPQPTPDLIGLAMKAIEAASSISLSEIATRCGTAEEATWVEQWPGEHYRLLAALVDVVGAREVVEIGTYRGLGALALRAGGAERVVTYDVVPWPDISGSVLRQSDFDGPLEQRLADLSSADVFANERVVLQNADLIFLDGPKDGRFEPLFIDQLVGLERKLPQLLVIDDIRLLVMLQLWRDLPLPKLDLTSFGHWSGTGLAVLD